MVFVTIRLVGEKESRLFENIILEPQVFYFDNCLYITSMLFSDFSWWFVETGWGHDTYSFAIPRNYVSWSKVAKFFTSFRLDQGFWRNRSGKLNVNV